ncbi:MAG: adenylyltransferase/cytidyltransferase family protein [Pseudomonadota bacterium]
MLSFQKKLAHWNPLGLDHPWAQLPRPWVFTNGCFDILHRGHITYLAQAKTYGSTLIVALNSDASVKSLNKGIDLHDQRPINSLEDRLCVIAALESVDCVISFNDSTPIKPILALRPDILIKGGDWPVSNIVGATEVLTWGGAVYSIPFEVERSTTSIVKKMRLTDTKNHDS